MGRRRKGAPVHGWINLDKPEGLGSTPAVSRIRRLYDAQKAGHAGTLDPLASGVLPIALGEATKTVPFLMEADKSYRFTVAWGAETSSGDRDGEVIAESTVRPTPAEAEAALGAFLGQVEQAPPKVSALKVDGQRAYDLAREGADFELAPRRVRIDRVAIVEAPDADHLTLEVDCGKGTYVRAIARDLARALGTVGHVSALRRTRVGPFHAAAAIPLDSLDDRSAATLELADESVYEAARQEALLPVETALDDIPALAMTAEDAFRLRQGRSVVLLPRQVEALRARLRPLTVAGQDASRTVLAVEGGVPVALAEMRAGSLNPVRVFQMS